jgi:hypothetical protein
MHEGIEQILKPEERELLHRAQALKDLLPTPAYQAYRDELFRYLIQSYHLMMQARPEDLAVARARHDQAWDFYRMVEGSVAGAELLLSAVEQRYVESVRAEADAARHPAQDATHALQRYRGAGLFPRNGG